MATTMTQVEDTERGKTILRIAGSMMHADAILLEKIALDLRSQIGKSLTLDMADLNFLDSDSAPILKRLQSEHGFEIEGMEFFVQNAITEVEAKNA